jgi:hypothetical protein
MASDPIYISSDNVIEAADQYDTVAGTYLNAATFTVTIKDLSGTSLSGISWPVTMSYVAASNGRYRAVIDKALSISPGITYFAEITGAESGVDVFYRKPLLGTYKQ